MFNARCPRVHAGCKEQNRLQRLLQSRRLRAAPLESFDLRSSLPSLIAYKEGGPEQICVACSGPIFASAKALRPDSEVCCDRSPVAIDNPWQHACGVFAYGHRAGIAAVEQHSVFGSKISKLLEHQTRR